MCSNNHETVKVLLNAGADINTISHSGVTLLMSLCASEDTSPTVLSMILGKLRDQNELTKSINIRARSQTIKWKIRRTLAKFMLRTRISDSTLITRVAKGSGEGSLSLSLSVCVCDTTTITTTTTT